MEFAVALHAVSYLFNNILCSACALYGANSHIKIQIFTHNLYGIDSNLIMVKVLI